MKGRCRDGPVRPDQRRAVRLVAVASSRTPSGTNSDASGGLHMVATVTREERPSGLDADSRVTAAGSAASSAST